MPHLSVKMFSGRPDEKKQELALALRKCVSDVLGCDPGHVSVSMEDVEPKNWDPVYNRDIRHNPNLILRPSYEPGDELKQP